VLIPAGLPLDSLSAPIIKPAARERRISMRKSICNPIFQLSNTMKKFRKYITTYKLYYKQ
jgi:hypothetical protein